MLCIFPSFCTALSVQAAPSIFFSSAVGVRPDEPDYEASLLALSAKKFPFFRKIFFPPSLCQSPWFFFLGNLSLWISLFSCSLPTLKVAARSAAGPAPRVPAPSWRQNVCLQYAHFPLDEAWEPLHRAEHGQRAWCCHDMALLQGQGCGQGCWGLQWCSCCSVTSGLQCCSHCSVTSGLLQVHQLPLQLISGLLQSCNAAPIAMWSQGFCRSWCSHCSVISGLQCCSHCNVISGVQCCSHCSVISGLQWCSTAGWSSQGCCRSISSHCSVIPTQPPHRTQHRNQPCSNYANLFFHPWSLLVTQCYSKALWS